jgi:hypothetical protein
MGLKKLIFHGDYIPYFIEKTGKNENGRPKGDQPPASPVRH